MKQILILLSIFILGLSLGILVTSHQPKRTEVDSETARLCQIYANRDHEKEIAPERWKTMGDWPQFDWYQSCINHELHPVAGR